MITIAFDADDTLWDNEIYFRESERQFCKLINSHNPNLTEKEIMPILFDNEVGNLSIYGFGVKSFVLSAIEAAGKLLNNDVPYSIVSSIVQIGREQLMKPVTLLADVEDTLKQLKESGKYRLVVATKGDLLDQESKIKRSGLEQYFERTIIMSDKREEDYRKMIKSLNCKPEKLVMVGNSFKSDILPVVNLGGRGIYIPYHTTWAHEVVETIEHERIVEITRLKEILELL
ncbi:MAG: HAD family hydrolase [Paludibacteraceae bacterium]|nr:HAD family hydrolase [Paludibacteraceae bacterium]MBQ5925426.1 HAD family hydrolase [Paludibacteraceae bacterium]